MSKIKVKHCDKCLRFDFECNSCRSIKENSFMLNRIREEIEKKEKEFFKFLKYTAEDLVVICETEEKQNNNYNYELI